MISKRVVTLPSEKGQHGFERGKNALASCQPALFSRSWHLSTEFARC